MKNKGKKFALQILEFSQKKLRKDELKLELVKSSDKTRGKKFASQILEFSQKKPGKEELRVELVKSSEKQGGKKICFANFGTLTEKTWKRRIEGGIGEI